MAWEQLEGLDPFVAITPAGRIVWNDAAQGAMGNPQSVQIHHDAAESRIGLRRVDIRADVGGLLVQQGEEAGFIVFFLEAFQHLDNASVSVDQLYVTDLNDPEFGIGSEGGAGIFWFDSP
jgi:hypothetical protein